MGLVVAVTFWPGEVVIGAAAPNPAGRRGSTPPTQEESGWRSAALQGDKAALDKILRNPDTLAKFSPDVLNYLLTQKDLAGFKRALGSGANPNVMVRITTTGRGSVPSTVASEPLLTLCCLEDDSVFLDAMLRHGADTEIIDQNKRTPLLRAVVENRPQAVALLVQHGANLAAKDINGDTALTFAQKLAPIARFLTKAAAGEVELPQLAAADLTLAKPDPENLQFYGPRTKEAALAIVRGDIFGVRRAITQGLEVNSADSEGGTLLRLALAAEHPAIFKELLSHQADPNKASVTHLAAVAAEPDYLREIIKTGADLNTRSRNQLTPLMAAVIKGRTAQAALLVAEKRVQLDAQDGSGNTALMQALLNRNQEIEKLLVLRGADTGLKNNQGLTAFDIAAGDALLEMAGPEPGKRGP
jgi:ankyrin repeat protein